MDFSVRADGRSGIQETDPVVSPSRRWQTQTRRPPRTREFIPYRLIHMISNRFRLGRGHVLRYFHALCGDASVEAPYQESSFTSRTPVWIQRIQRVSMTLSVKVCDQTVRPFSLKQSNCSVFFDSTNCFFGNTICLRTMRSSSVVCPRQVLVSSVELQRTVRLDPSRLDRGRHKSLWSWLSLRYSCFSTEYFESIRRTDPVRSNHFDAELWTHLFSSRTNCDRQCSSLLHISEEAFRLRWFPDSFDLLRAWSLWIRVVLYPRITLPKDKTIGESSSNLTSTILSSSLTLTFNIHDSVSNLDEVRFDCRRHRILIIWCESAPTHHMKRSVAVHNVLATTLNSW